MTKMSVSYYLAVSILPHEAKDLLELFFF